MQNAYIESESGRNRRWNVFIRYLNGDYYYEIIDGSRYYYRGASDQRIYENPEGDVFQLHN